MTMKDLARGEAAMVLDLAAHSAAEVRQVQMISSKSL